MAKSPILTLPRELLDYMVDLLYDTHPADVFLLSLVNRQLRASACRRLFGHVVIRGADVERLVEIPRHAWMREHITSITVKGGVTDLTKDSWGYEEITPVAARTKEEEAWQPLADFILELPALSSVVYDADSVYFPTSLSRALRALEKTVKLHIRKPWFYPVCSADVEEISESSLLVLTYPSLKSVTVSIDLAEFSAQSRGGMIPPLELITSRAPGLENIFLVIESHWRTVEVGSSFKRAEQPSSTEYEEVMRLSSRGMDQIPVRAPVTGLRLDLEQPLKGEFFQYLRKTIDFASLHTLVLIGRTCPSVFLFLASGHFFPSLKCLEIDLTERRPARGVVMSEWFRSNFNALENSGFSYLQAFLRTLPPLSVLKLRGFIGKGIWETAIWHHGHSLRELWLHPDRALGFALQLCGSDIAEIAQHCPGIETLNIMTPRARWTIPETALYENMGKFPNLTQLCLTLNISNIWANALDTADEQTWYRTLVDCAVDQVMVRSIYNIISESRKRESCSNYLVDKMIPLQKLKIEVASPLQGRFLVRPEFTDLARVIPRISKRWVLRWDTRSDLPNKLIALDRTSPGASGVYLPAKLYEDSERVFRQVWPEHRSARQHWEDDWFSLPLTTVDTLRLQHTSPAEP